MALSKELLDILACPKCKGSRLKPEVQHVLIENRSIVNITQMSIEESFKFFKSLKLDGSRKLIAGELLKEISNRLGFLMNVGLTYLTLDRKGPIAFHIYRSTVRFFNIRVRQL